MGVFNGLAGTGLGIFLGCKLTESSSLDLNISSNPQSSKSIPIPPETFFVETSRVPSSCSRDFLSKTAEASFALNPKADECKLHLGAPKAPSCYKNFLDNYFSGLDSK